MAATHSGIPTPPTTPEKNESRIDATDTDMSARSWVDLARQGVQAAAVVGLLLAATVVVFGKEGLPSGVAFQLVLLWLLSTVTSAALSAIKLPSLCGPLLIGVLLGNLGLLSAVTPSVTKVLKGASVALIMMRAGLSLNLRTLWRCGSATVLLSVVPCLVEMTAVAAGAVLLFDQMNLPWGVMLGFALSDVSPAVTVPLLTDLKKRGYGTAQGIPTVLLAAGSLNSVLCIVGFEITMSMALAGGQRSIAESLGRGLGGLFGGVAVGVLAGLLTRALIGLAPTNAGLLGTGPRQAAGLMIVALVLYFGFGLEGVDLGGAGTMACVALGATYSHAREGASQRPVEKKLSAVVINDLKELEPAFETASIAESDIGALEVAKGTGPSAEDTLKAAWLAVGQVYLFGFLGGALDLSLISTSVLGKAVGVILLALPFRCVAAYYCAAAGRWSVSDRLFTAVSWLPKATVQAALSTVALQFVESQEGSYSSEEAYSQDWDRSMIILAAATLSIVLTAPTGAVAIEWFGPRLLRLPDGPSSTFSGPESPDADAEPERPLQFLAEAI